MTRRKTSSSSAIAAPEKSETLEALRIIGKDYIKQMKIVFDDMGTFFKKDGHIYAHGRKSPPLSASMISKPATLIRRSTGPSF
jgi:hypothetical protein